MNDSEKEAQRLRRRIKKYRRQAESMRLALLAKRILHYDDDPETAALLAIRSLKTAHSADRAAVTDAGGTFTFKVTGDLHIIEITKPVTFDVTVKVDSASQISGSAKTIVKRSDFNLKSPTFRALPT